MPHAGKIGAEGRAAEIVERGYERTPRRSRYGRLKLRQHALAVGLPKRNKARAGGYPVRHNCVKKSVDGRRERYAMRGAYKANRDRIDNRGFARCDQPIQRFGIPCGSRDLDERPALRRRLEMALARGRKGRREFSNFREHHFVTRRRGAVDVRQKD